MQYLFYVLYDVSTTATCYRSAHVWTMAVTLVNTQKENTMKFYIQYLCISLLIAKFCSELVQSKKNSDLILCYAFYSIAIRCTAQPYSFLLSLCLPDVFNRFSRLSFGNFSLEFLKPLLAEKLLKFLVDKSLRSIEILL